MLKSIKRLKKDIKRSKKNLKKYIEDLKNLEDFLKPEKNLEKSKENLRKYIKNLKKIKEKFKKYKKNIKKYKENLKRSKKNIKKYKKNLEKYKKSFKYMEILKYKKISDRHFLKMILEEYKDKEKFLKSKLNFWLKRRKSLEARRSNKHIFRLLLKKRTNFSKKVFKIGQWIFKKPINKFFWDNLKIYNIDQNFCKKRTYNFLKLPKVKQILFCKVKKIIYN